MSAEWRRNPFTGQYIPQLVVDEPHTVQPIPEKGIYGIQLKYSPLQTTPNPMSIRDAGTNVGMTERPHTLDPNANEFRVDYEAPNQWGTGIVEMNASDNNKNVKVTYNHSGLVVRASGLAILLDGQTIANLDVGNLGVTNDLDVANILNVNDLRTRILRALDSTLTKKITIQGEPTADRVQGLADKNADFVYDDEFEGLSSGKRIVDWARIQNVPGSSLISYFILAGGGASAVVPTTGYYLKVTLTGASIAANTLYTINGLILLNAGDTLTSPPLPLGISTVYFLLGYV